MLRLRPLLFAPLALLFATAQGNAAVLFHADLTGAQENPPVATSAFGFADFVLNDSATALTFTATIFGIDVTGSQSAALDDDLLAAHIHAPAPPGMNANVVWGFFGAPDNDIAPNDLVVTPFGTGLGGTFSSKWDLNEGNMGQTLTSQLTNLLSDRTYINFHTREFGGGEIRGQILTPEPTSLILLGTGLLGLARARARRKSRTIY